jgi:hypothetical protein
MQVRDFKQSTSGFIHGFRYGVRALHRILEQRYHQQPWPHRRLTSDAEVLMQAVIERVNRTSALWQLFGFLADLIVVSQDGSARYHEEVPLDYIHDSELGHADSYFSVTLEYGPEHDRHDPFDPAVLRVSESDAEGASLGRYLHPVIRHFAKGKLVAEHHVTENLENEWTSPATHCEPLTAFFAREALTRVQPLTRAL